MLHGLARKVKARERLYFPGSHAQWAVWGAVCQNVRPCSRPRRGQVLRLSSSAFFTSILGHSAAPGTRELMVLRKTKRPSGPQIQSY